MANYHVNLEMVKASYAWHYKKHQNEQSSDDKLSYALAENNARSHKLGLFQDSNSIEPWQWRKNKKNLLIVKPVRKPQAQLLTSVSSNIQVWVNLKSGKYHCPETRYYGNTKRGELMSESTALNSGYSGAHGLTCK